MVSGVRAIPYVSRFETYKMFSYHYHSEAETKCLPFRSLHLRVHFPELKCMNFTQVCSMFRINNVPSLVLKLDWCQPGDEPLSGLMIM